jgi:peptidoglycan hydrolase-like protein with peptidoglycan-binding domain
MTTIQTPLGSVEFLPYPGRLLKIGDFDIISMTRVQQRLNAVGCGPITENGFFDEDTKKAIKLFQIRYPDLQGHSLVVDGILGILTWGALFGAESVSSYATAPSILTLEVINYAISQIGVLEDPLGSNRGPVVDQYQQAVGLNLKPGKSGYSWCVAFTYFCYQQAANEIGLMSNPHIKTAGALDHWNKVKTKSGITRISRIQAIGNPSLIKPGAIFIIDYGNGLGHTGIVKEINQGRLVTIEGNTNPGGSSNGIGVFKRNSRKISDINRGFIDYSSF